MDNIAFGWIWITLGLITGAIIGLFFRRAGWLGGYDALPRRLVRLGHIAFFGTGILNLLYGLSVDEVGLTGSKATAVSWGLIVGAFAMPLVCFLVAWREKLHPLFVVPVAALIYAGVTISVGGLSR